MQRIDLKSVKLIRQQDVYNVFMHIQKDGITPDCSVSTSFLAVISITAR